MPDTPTPTKFRQIDPAPDPTRDNSELVHAAIPKKIFDYFFHHVLTGDRGPRQIIVRILFNELHKSCIAAGIKPEWDASNESRVVAILANLNFRPQPDFIRAGQRTGKSESNTTADSLRSESRPERPVRTGRTDTRAPKSQGKPKVGNGHGRGTQGNVAETPNLRDVSADVGSEDTK